MLGRSHFPDMDLINFVFKEGRKYGFGPDRTGIKVADMFRDSHPQVRAYSSATVYRRLHFHIRPNIRKYPVSEEIRNFIFRRRHPGDSGGITDDSVSDDGDGPEPNVSGNSAIGSSGAKREKANGKRRLYPGQPVGGRRRRLSELSDSSETEEHPKNHGGVAAKVVGPSSSLGVKRVAHGRGQTKQKETVGALADFPVIADEMNGSQDILARERVGKTSSNVTQGPQNLSERLAPTFQMIKTKEEKKRNALDKNPPTKAAIVPVPKPSAAPVPYSRYGQEELNKARNATTSEATKILPVQTPAGQSDTGRVLYRGPNGSVMHEIKQLKSSGTKPPSVIMKRIPDQKDNASSSNGGAVKSTASTASSSLGLNTVRGVQSIVPKSVQQGAIVPFSMFELDRARPEEPEVLKSQKGPGPTEQVAAVVRRGASDSEESDAESDAPSMKTVSDASSNYGRAKDPAGPEFSDSDSEDPDWLASSEAEDDESDDDDTGDVESVKSGSLASSEADRGEGFIASKHNPPAASLACSTSSQKKGLDDDVVFVWASEDAEKSRLAGTLPLVRFHQDEVRVKVEEPVEEDEDVMVIREYARRVHISAEEALLVAARKPKEFEKIMSKWKGGVAVKREPMDEK